jgi:hypothetical protein
LVHFTLGKTRFPFFAIRLAILAEDWFNHCAQLNFFTAMSSKITIFWQVKPYDLLARYQHCRRTGYLPVFTAEQPLT